MPVVIEELQIEAQAPRAATPAADAAHGASNVAFDERPVREMLEREAARLARLHTD